MNPLHWARKHGGEVTRPLQRLGDLLLKRSCCVTWHLQVSFRLLRPLIPQTFLPSPAYSKHTLPLTSLARNELGSLATALLRHLQGPSHQQTVAGKPGALGVLRQLRPATATHPPKSCKKTRLKSLNICNCSTSGTPDECFVRHVRSSIK